MIVFFMRTGKIGKKNIWSSMEIYQNVMPKKKEKKTKLVVDRNSKDNEISKWNTLVALEHIVARPWTRFETFDLLYLGHVLRLLTCSSYSSP